jgi:predicted RNase H-like HicB family nuclease
MVVKLNANQPGYSQHVAWSAEDEMYVATCPELEGLSALAESEEAAVRELKTAMALVIEDMLAQGEPLPAPYTHASHSGQFRVRIPRTLHGRLVQLASREGVSLNSLVTTLLAEGSATFSADSPVQRNRGLRKTT